MARTTCLHCAQPLAGSAGDFCCAGCEAVHAALLHQGLERFYALRGNLGTPVSVRETSTSWLEPDAKRLSGTEGTSVLNLDVQGLHCSGCVWLLQRIFERLPGAGRLVVNPSVGHMELWVTADFPLLGFARELASFGYLVGPAGKASEHAHEGLQVRLAIAVALALNSMVLSAALYLGLREGPLFELFRQLNFALGAVSVAVGGSYFLRTAWQAARRGVAHLDQPIALGILLAFGGSTLAMWRGSQDIYFDTLCVFVALMLTGRWIQERVLARNRRYLLQDDGIDELAVRRVCAGQVQWTRCGKLMAGDVLLIAPGDLIPTPARILDPGARVSLQWIDGEPAPRRFRTGEALPAGAFNAGAEALRVEVLEDFSASPLRQLLGAPREAGVSQSGRFWSGLARAYVAIVLGVAGTAFATWWSLAGLDRAVSVATAVLVVTCPCAFGIATPLAYELVLTRLRRMGLFVRSADLLDRLRDVRQVVFDKTGTLTTGALRLEDAAPLKHLGVAQRDILFQLAVRSSHPKAAAVERGLMPRDAHLRDDLQVHEVPGYGMQVSLEGHTWRLGAPAWAAAGVEADELTDLVFARDGRALAILRTQEDARPDARVEIAELRGRGYELWVLSGDSSARTVALAGALGIGPDHVLAERTAQEKALWLSEHDGEHTMMLGDGVNDAPAMRAALCGGTPAVDRPFMPARTDFYFVTPGLSPVRSALVAAGRLHGVVVENLSLALVYNVAAVTLACAGWMAPWIAAVSMPLSSLAVIGWTLHRLPMGGAVWKS